MELSIFNGTYIDYISSTGTQYIDTNYKPNANTKVVIDFEDTTSDKHVDYAYDKNELIILDSQGDYVIYQDAGENTCFEESYFGGDIMRLTRSIAESQLDYYNIDSCETFNYDPSIRKTLTCTPTSIVCDGKTLATLQTVDTTSTNNLLIFQSYFNNELAEYGSYKLYGLKIYENNVLVRDLRPCLDEQNIACLWDEVECTYYYNEGTGVFSTPGLTLISSININPNYRTTNRTEYVATTYNTFTATILPADATNQTLTWTCSDNDIIEIVSIGINANVVEVRYKYKTKSGSATITATAKDGSGISATYYDIVNFAPTALTLSNSNLNMTVGDMKAISVDSFVPDTTTITTVNWSSLNESVATVVDGTITAEGPGSCTIRATSTANPNAYADCSINVAAASVPVQEITLSASALSLAEGESKTITYDIQPANATNKNVIISSNNNDIVTIAHDKATKKITLTARAAGTFMLTVTTEDGGHEAQCVVTITEAIIPVQGITLSQNTLNLNTGNNATLTYTITPANATNKRVTWSSSDMNVISVVDGVVTANRAGSSTITVTTEDGSFFDTCTITVADVAVLAKSISLDRTTIDVDKDISTTLTATILPENTTNKNVVWSSSKPTIAKVENGLVTGLAKGQTVITAKTSDGSNLTASCTVNVLIPVTGISLNKNSINLNPNGTTQLVATVLPANASNTNIIWETSNPSVITVNKGLVTAKTIGSATITARTEDGNYTAVCVINVTNAVVNVQSISLNKNNLEVITSEVQRLVATITPSNATNQNINWSTNNDKVATVTNTGEVTALSAGTATITATSVDGSHTASCTVKVYNSAILKVELGNLSLDDGTLDDTYSNRMRGKKLIAVSATSLYFDYKELDGLVRYYDKDGNYISSTGGWTTNGTITLDSNVAYVKPVMQLKDSTNITSAGVNGKNIIIGDTIYTLVYDNTISNISFSSKEINMTVNDTKKLTVTISPIDADTSAIAWSSSVGSVATVADGTVNALTPGNTIISVSSTDGGNVSAECKINVAAKIIMPTGISLSSNSLSVNINTVTQLLATVAPETATDKTVTWTTNNNKVATVSGGLVTAVGKGSCTITATTVNGLKATCSITVAVPVSSVELNYSTKDLVVGDTLQLTATVLPANANNKNVVWATNKSSLATVTNTGEVKAIAPGSVAITATTVDGNKVATCILTINAKQVALTSISIPGTLSMNRGESRTLTVTYTPETASNKNITWSSNNNAVATVSSTGSIKAIGLGTCKITATSEYDSTIKAECTITVTESSDAILAMRIKGNILYVQNFEDGRDVMSLVLTTLNLIDIYEDLNEGEPIKIDNNNALHVYKIIEGSDF